MNLYIRNLCFRRNGIVDDKFLKYFQVGHSYGTEHQMSIDEVLDKIEYLAGIVDKIDNAAILKYNLSTL